jgi:phosphoglycerol transferase MdoB-like AlkP superfamily enzyme
MDSYRFEHLRHAVIRRAIDFVSRDPGPFLVLFACVLLIVGSASERFVGLLTETPSALSFSCMVLVLVLFIPGRYVALAVPLAVGVLLAIGEVNDRKVAALGLPVTSFDLYMVAVDPRVVLNAVGVGRTGLHGITAVAFAIPLGLCALVTMLWRRHPGRPAIALRLLALMLVLVTSRSAFAQHSRLVDAQLQTRDVNLWRRLWRAESQVELSRRLGVIEYLAFTSFSAGRERSLAPRSAPDGFDAIKIVGASGVNRLYPARSTLPNIVFFHAESTFDPNSAFTLAQPVVLPLWSRLPSTRILAPLRVNVLGGGSWVTEFEVLTGVDSRIFGYQGFYTHHYLAPGVKWSFVRYLSTLGYRSTAYYSAASAFYNVGAAFGNYGFDEFLDANALGLPADWGQLRDSEIVRAVIERGAFDAAGPFFHFISTAENHGPHPCTGVTDRVEFSGPATAEETCQLSEYVKRARSTSAAFEQVLEQLRRIEQVTGRPFLLLTRVRRSSAIFVHRRRVFGCRRYREATTRGQLLARADVC